MTRLLIIITCALLAACTKTDVSISNKLKSTTSNNTYTITYFNDKGNVETDHFTGYTFRFEPDGTFTAKVLSATYTGTWTAVFNASDDSPEHEDLQITITGSANLDSINDDWHIIALSKSEIELEDVSGSGEVETLIFSRI